MHNHGANSFSIGVPIPFSRTPSTLRNGSEPLGNLFSLSRREILSRSLSKKLSNSVIEDLFKDLRASTLRQYQSCWSAFQRFCKVSNITEVSQDVVLRFLSYLFHERNYSVATINTHIAALKDPLWYGFQVVLDPRVLDLLRRSFFLQRPPSKTSRPFWSLSKVLNSLSPPEFPSNPSKILLLHKAVFLLALATGLRASQLHALTRRPAWTIFASGDTQVSLAPLPSFLAKNEREQHRLQPIIIPAWSENGVPHRSTPCQSSTELLISHHFCSVRFALCVARLPPTMFQNSHS